MVLAHLRSGQAARGTELMSITRDNTHHSRRRVYGALDDLSECSRSGACYEPFRADGQFDRVAPTSTIEAASPKVAPWAPRSQAPLRAVVAAGNAAPLLTNITQPPVEQAEKIPAGLARLLAKQSAEIIRHLQGIWGQETPDVAKGLQAASRSSC
ncbi:hypothetical protein K470DRAFT_269949 [Piedraia hortae CBS 480.64]|uniref:Uncharacterized protein n=1 Tax=Piedraia hortae CBS 480.64 TaxID=1314780 RepID=A0A6A7C1H4_9PEZI|nr:hypothetical protein K470DRAFT_269949 [Piedraia hortae CBS 480.64]